MIELEKVLYEIGNNPDLHEACQGLLKYFKLDYTEISPSILTVTDFLDEKFVNSHADLLEKVGEVRIVGAATPDTFLSRSASAISREELEEKTADEKYEDMIFFSIDARSPMTRSEIAMLTRAFNRRFYYKPVVLFVRYDKYLSMTTCERTAYIRAGYEGEKVGKVTILYRINCEKPHAGHINILNCLDISGCTSFEAVYQKWLYTFSNELLTRKFYQELSDWYAWAIKVVRFPNRIEDPDDDGKYNHENVIRLVTRLIFVWFLKEKHLIPEEFFDQKYIAEHLIEGFAPNEQANLFGKSTESKYYKAILQNLFFAMLNCPIVDEETGAANRRFCEDGTDPDNTKLMRYKKYFKEPQRFIDLANQNVPFLNGGLFDCLDNRKEGVYYDAFSDNEKIGKCLEVPDFLFFGEEAGKNIDLSEFYGDDNKKKVSARGIIDILAKYKFTIEENTPYDQEVSLDPELLGKVFENLLAAFNPETKTTARKQTGSFYTPRDIVQYMVDESLVEHLKRTVGAELEPRFRELVSYSTDDVVLTDEEKKKIMQSLYNCKILDPACGSGAFPVGMLQQMVHIISRIDPENKMWYDLIIDEATRQSREAFETESDNERNEKLEDIKQSFDQSLNYPDYARKLYLIENCIYGGDLQPIAIQISKLRFFISLIVDQKENNDPTKNFGIRPLPNLEAKFVACNSLVPLEKNADLFSSSDEIVALEKRMHEANHKIFTAKSPQKKAAWRKILAESREKMAETLLESGFVSQSSSQMIASWNMFDQNSSAGFFDSEWMFDIRDGFDIVVGNPPYCQIPKNLYSSEVFPYSEGKDKGKQNLYKLFTELAYNICKKEGIVCMIVQSSLMCDLSSSYTRELLLTQTRVKQVIEFPKIAPTPGGQVFSSVCQGTCIYLFQKAKPDGIPFLLSVNNDCTTLSHMDTEMVSQQDIVSFYPEDNAIPLLRKGDFNVLRKIKNSANQLADFIVDIAQGDMNLTTGKRFIKQDNTGIKLLRGRSIASFKINYDVDEFIEATYRTDYVKNNHAKTYILCQEITGTVDPRRIHCSISDANQSFLCGHTVNKIDVINPEHLLYIVGLLNSKLMDWIFRKTSSNNHVAGYELKQLPIIMPHNFSSINDLVRKLMACEYGKALDAKEAIDLDILIYKTYKLTYDEILVIDPDTPILKDDYDSIVC